MRSIWDKIKEYVWMGAAVAVVLLLLVGAFWPRPAKAADLGDGPLIPGLTVGKSAPWTGVYAGVGGGYQVADTEISVPSLSILDGISGRGWAADARLGFDWQPSGTPFVIGVLGGYNLGEAEFGAFNGALTATLEPQWYVGGRLGLALPTKTLLYGGLAWQRAEGTVSLSGVGSASATEDGLLYLAGIEQSIGPHLTLGAEYSLARYEFAAGPLSIDPDVHAFKVRLNWRPFSK